MFLFSAADTPISRDSIPGAIRNAARSTGADFGYLLSTAERESSLDPAAKAPTSSATGLFQFVDQTWLQMVKEEGPSHGLGAYADAIEQTGSGRYTVRDEATRRDILALRKDPQAASVMAGAFTQRNREALAGSLGRQPSDGELYMAHFMGASGASALIRLAAQNPDANAAAAFPSQAAANRSIFYTRDGQPKTASAVYANLVSHKASAPAAVTAASDPAETQTDDDEKLSSNPARWLAIPVHNAYAIEAIRSVDGTAPSRELTGLSRMREGAPVSRAVTETWSNLAATPADMAPSASLPPPMDLAAVLKAPDPRRKAQPAPMDLLSQNRAGSGNAETGTAVSQASSAGGPSFGSFFASLFSVQPNANHAGASGVPAS